ncbi:MAG: pilus assembly protein PilM [Candidatus Paceibacterota bacterium]|jgi:type IV pilus assembly protein PilM
MFNIFQRKAFGLDISDQSIEVLELEKKSGKVFLKAYGRVEIGEGLVRGGVIVDRDALAIKIKQVLAEAQPRPIKIKKVVCSLPESQTFFHFFPSGEDIEQQAAKTLPINLADFYFNYREGLFSAVSKKIVEDYLSVLNAAGLDPEVLDLESASIARAFGEGMGVKEESYLVADIGCRSTVLTVYDGRAIRLSVAVPAGGDVFSKVLADNLKITLAEAEQLKRDCGFDVEKKEGEIIFILQSAFQEIINGIKNSVNFYRSKSQKKISKILLCGGSSLIPKVDFYLSSIIDIPVEIPDPWEGIDVEEILKKKELRNMIETSLHPIFFANVIGLAKRGISKDPGLCGVNLIPLKKGGKRC